jgi:hypothetical protein
MDRPRRTRRRFETERVVRNRRKQILNEGGDPRRLAYGRLAKQDPFDCGHPACGLCNPRDLGRRGRERRQWRDDWEL